MVGQRAAMGLQATPGHGLVGRVEPPDLAEPRQRRAQVGRVHRSRLVVVGQVTRRELDLDGPEAEALAGEVRTLTEAAIRRLPLKQRLAFTLRKLHELDYELIGQSLDCSAESARAHVFQALRKIRTTLNGHALPPTESTR